MATQEQEPVHTDQVSLKSHPATLSTPIDRYFFFDYV